jgi:hypothetical protein
MAIHTKPKGRPEEKDRRETEAVRQDLIAWMMLARVPRGFVLVGVGRVKL